MALIAESAFLNIITIARSLASRATSRRAALAHIPARCRCDLPRIGTRRMAQVTGGETKIVAVDCEMVAGGGGKQLLARAVVVDWRGAVLYDRHVRIREPVVDYATRYSGIRPSDVAPDAPGAEEADDVRRAVRRLLFGRVLVGHDLRNDLRVLQVVHPPELRRDTYRLLRHVVPRARLSALSESVLGVPALHAGEHCPVQDARAALAIYLRVAQQVARGAEHAGVANAKQLKSLSKRKVHEELRIAALASLVRIAGMAGVYLMVEDIKLLDVGEDELNNVFSELIDNLQRKDE